MKLFKYLYRKGPHDSKKKMELKNHKLQNKKVSYKIKTLDVALAYICKIDYLSKYSFKAKLNKICI